MHELGVGVVGYGFIGKVHTFSYRAIPMMYEPPPARVRLVGVCTSRPETAEAARDHGGFEFATTDYRRLLERKDIQIINCCTPNDLHHPLLCDALAAGKHIYCDKPLALNLAQAEEIAARAQGAPGTHQMTFNYRFVPAIMRAKELVEDGFFGDFFSFRAAYLHAGYTDPNRPMSWRLDLARSGGGAIADLGSHAIDLVRHLLGEFRQVSARAKTFIASRPVAPGAAERAPVRVDDVTTMQAELEGGALGTLEFSRLATGAMDELRIEAHGSGGAFAFNLMDPNWLQVFDNRRPERPLGGDRGFTRVESAQRYPAPAALPGPKFGVGWMRFHIASLYEFLRRAAAGEPGCPSFDDGLAAHRVIDAALRASESGRWVEVGSSRP